MSEHPINTSYVSLSGGSAAAPTQDNTSSRATCSRLSAEDNNDQSMLAKYCTVHLLTRACTCAGAAALFTISGAALSKTQVQAATPILVAGATGMVGSALVPLLPEGTIREPKTSVWFMAAGTVIGAAAWAAAYFLGRGSAATAVKAA